MGLTPIPEKCPICHHPRVQFNAAAIWCIRCGWAQNRYPKHPTL